MAIYPSPVPGRGQRLLTSRVIPARKDQAKIIADSGSYAVTGTAAGVVYGHPMSAGAGDYLIVGADSVRAFELNAVSGTYTVTGTAATFRVTWIFHVDAGSYSLTGTDASLEFGGLVAADSGTYAINGTAADLIHGGSGAKIIAADSGTYDLTGTAVTFKVDWRFQVDAGSYTVSGTAVTFLGGWRLTAVSGSYTLTGTDAGTIYTPVVVVNDHLLSIMGCGG